MACCKRTVANWVKSLHLFFLLTTMVFAAEADVTLPLIFSDGVVLQRDRPIRVWGWADPKEKIKIILNRQTRNVVANEKGEWQVRLTREPAGGPYDLIVQASNTITISDVMIGDVWICAGQSNMQFTVWKSLAAKEEIATADFPEIRHFKVDAGASLQPQRDLENSRWQTCTPKTVGGFTAVGYFFAREIFRETDIPIGIINISRGGSNIENWISITAFQNDPYFESLSGPLASVQFSPEYVEANEKIFVNNFPGVLFNAMVHPVTPFGIKGVVWYQGESNIGRAFEYRRSFKLLIEDWRAQWGQGDFPFLFVQLPGYKGNGGDSNSGSRFAELRESQASVLSLPNTAMAVTTDVGEANDLHPKNKQAVGKRLAALALNFFYDKPRPAQVPSFSSMRIDKGAVRVSFEHVGSGLMIKGDKIIGFEVMDEHGNFYPSRAVVDGNEVIVSHADVKFPKAVRFCWRDDASACNLFNKEGFPVAPFRTDSLIGITAKSTYRIDPKLVTQ